MRVGVTGKLVVKMNIPVAVRNATTLRGVFRAGWLHFNLRQKRNDLSFYVAA